MRRGNQIVAVTTRETIWVRVVRLFHIRLTFHLRVKSKRPEPAGRDRVLSVQECL